MYCKDKDRTRDEDITEFDFIGYTFKAVYIMCKDGKRRSNFIASVSKMSAKTFRDKIKALEMKYTLQCIERRLVKWEMCKYKNFRGHRRRAEKWLLSVRKREPKLFAHWSKMYSYC